MEKPLPFSDHSDRFRKLHGTVTFAVSYAADARRGAVVTWGLHVFEGFFDAGFHSFAN